MGEAEVSIIKGSIQRTKVRLAHLEKPHAPDDIRPTVQKFPEPLTLGDKPVYIEHSSSVDGPVDVEIGSTVYEIFPGTNRTFTDDTSELRIIHHETKPTVITKIALEY